jgi:ATP phosphoribosyltransferase regulatory subunit
LGAFDRARRPLFDKKSSAGRLPAGTRDWLPAELARKRALEAVLRDVFERRGYAEVQTPGFERFDVLALGLGDDVARKTFLFTDNTGTQLALRPEMTTPVARVVATSLRDQPLPLRISYVQPAYRYAEPQEGRMREFTQAGIELVGPQSLEADTESLLTAIEALDAIGMSEAQFDLNHVAVIDGVLASFGWDAHEVDACKLLIAGRNIVSLRSFLLERGAEARIDEIVRLVMLRGGDDVLDRARASCATAAGLEGIERLRALIAIARERGHGHRIAIDLSLLRDISYYTGFIFESFSGDIGFALCGGGRYDALLPRFGFDAGAVGWSVNVERLLMALERGSR